MMTGRGHINITHILFRAGSFEIFRHVQNQCDLLADRTDGEFLICAGAKSSGLHKFLQHAVECLSRVHETFAARIE